MRSTWLLFTLCMCGWCLPRTAMAGLLQDVEDRAEGRRDERERRSSGSGADQRAGGNESRATRSDASSSDHPFGRFMLQVLLAPWTVPRLLADDPCFERFAEYPYADAPGLARAEIERPGCAPEPASAQAVSTQRIRRFSGHMELEGGYVLGNLVAGSVAARAQLPARISLEGRLSYWEDLFASPRELALGGTANVSYRFAQSRWVAFRTGAGMRVFALNTPQLGVDFLYGVDFFGKRPILAHLELHAGTLNKAFAGQARLTLGVQIWKLELYAGYDHQVVASEGRRARLHGPLLGVRAWF